ncbi:PASTA domain-containing protein [Ferruginibacter sp.]
MFNFLTKRPLWVNILAAAILTFLLLFLFLKMLGWITRHGEYLTVPAVVGKKTEDAIKLLEKQGFEVQIQDSVYTDTAARGIVLKQLPDPNSTVKINRTVFITVNRVTPPMVDMPKLEGQTINAALDMLRRSHLQLGDTTFKNDFAYGTVLEQRYNGGRIPEKTKIQWGSRVDLVISNGPGDKEIPVPDLLGMTFVQAKAYMEENGIILGASLLDNDVRDTANAFIWQQRPERFDEEKKIRFMKPGQIMDVWLSSAMKIVKDSVEIKNEK